MRIFIPAASMAIIASAATTRGLGVTKQITRSRCVIGPRRRWPSSSSSSSSSPSSGLTRPSSAADAARYFFRRATVASSTSMSFACFVAPDGATTELSATAAASATSSNRSDIDDDDDDDDEDAMIERMARESLSIVGSLPPPSSFGGIPYLDTSSLDSTGSHRVVFVLGGPGAGKGTQSKRIVDAYKCVHLSVGELLRRGAERAGYPHAELIRRTLVAGNIVPVELSLGLLREAMDEAAAAAAAVEVEGDRRRRQHHHDDDTTNDDDDDAGYGSRIFLVDGFPRNHDNVRGWMEDMPHHASVLGALVYDCPMEELERRILSRVEASGRSDDNLISARKRFDTFRDQTVPVVRALERAQEMLAKTDGAGGGGIGGGGTAGGSRLNIVNIDASGSIEEVWEATKGAMDEYVRNDVLTANVKLLKAIDDCDIAGVTTLSDEDELLDGVDPIHDGSPPTTKTATNTPSFSSISNGRVDIVNGIKAIVSYDRKMKGGMKVRETRVWKHGPIGWKCVGVTRV
ncbi:hypothetical protein ACHAXA_007660 [Cyclostephanos tholiformis]|uniref:Adenylate kinase n=1 Tax=Cyclostephanos tholiformis TaxID=382380 RepID=A0ABD3SDD1_9STRA